MTTTNQICFNPVKDLKDSDEFIKKNETCTKDMKDDGCLQGVSIKKAEDNAVEVSARYVKDSFIANLKDYKFILKAGKLFEDMQLKFSGRALYGPHVFSATIEEPLNKTYCVQVEYTRPEVE